MEKTETGYPEDNSPRVYKSDKDKNEMNVCRAYLKNRLQISNR